MIEKAGKGEADFTYRPIAEITLLTLELKPATF